MKIPQPEKKLVGIKVYDIEYLAVIDPHYRNEYADDNDMTPLEVNEWIDELKSNTEILFTLTDQELENCEDEDELEELLTNCIEEETSEYFQGYNWEFVYEEDLVESN